MQKEHFLVYSKTYCSTKPQRHKIPQINSAIEIGHKYGMITMKQSIQKLITDGDISQEVGEQIIESFDLSATV